MIVRKATPDDAKQIKILHTKTYKISYRNFIPDDYLDNLEITEEKIQKLKTHIQESTYFVATENEQILGFINIGCNSLDTLEIYALYIDPDFQKQGIGSALINTAIKENKNSNKCILWTMKYGPSLKFYEKHGFHPTSNEKMLKFDIPIIMLEKEI